MSSCGAVLQATDGDAPNKERDVKEEKRPGRKTRFPGVTDLGSGRYRVRSTAWDPTLDRQVERERIVTAASAEEAMAKKLELTSQLANAVKGEAQATRRSTMGLGSVTGARTGARTPEPAIQLAGQEGRDGQIGWNGSRLLGDVAQAWVDEITTRRHEQDPRQLHLCPSTSKRYKGVVRNFVRPAPLAKLVVSEIAKDDVRRWRKEQLDVGYPTSTVNGNFSVLQSIMRAAGNPDAVDLPMFSTKADAKTNRKQPNKLNAEQLDRFLAVAAEVCAKDRFAAILMLFTTTLRPGAIMPLRMDDFDLETMEVVSSRRVSDGEVVPGVKGDRFGEDTPPLLPEVYEAILEARKTYNEAQLASGLVFPAKDGGLHDRQWLSEAFKEIVKKAGITIRFTPTGARRTGETWYGRTEGTSRVSMAISGHRTEAMHRHYGSAGADEKLELAKRTWAPHLRVVNGAKVEASGNSAKGPQSGVDSGDRSGDLEEVIEAKS